MSTKAADRSVPSAAVRHKTPRTYLLMLCFVISASTLFLQFLPDFERVWNEWPRAGKQTPGRYKLSDGKGNTFETQYLLYLPSDYPLQKKWPLLLYLHGSGRRGDNINEVTKEGPPYFIEHGKQLCLIVVSPLCPANETWDSSRLLALLDAMQRDFAVDPNRIYVSGSSMGGYGTWALIEAAAYRFAAAAPVCGGGDVSQVDRLVKLPIWVFHGKEDSVVAFRESQQIVDAINQLGGNARLTAYEKQGQPRLPSVGFVHMQHRKD